MSMAESSPHSPPAISIGMSQSPRTSDGLGRQHFLAAGAEDVSEHTLDEVQCHDGLRHDAEEQAYQGEETVASLPPLGELGDEATCRRRLNDMPLHAHVAFRRRCQLGLLSRNVLVAILKASNAPPPPRANRCGQIALLRWLVCSRAPGADAQDDFAEAVRVRVGLIADSTGEHSSRLKIVDHVATFQIITLGRVGGTPSSNACPRSFLQYWAS